MYALNKRTISQYLRGECRRRLRLDLYANDRARREANAPAKDVARPGLALLVEQGRRFEREKFNELSQSFAGRVTHGAVADPRPGEERSFSRINLVDRIDNCTADHFLIEAEYTVTRPFIVAHSLGDLADGSAFPEGSNAILLFGAVRPDIIQLRPSTGAERESISSSGEIQMISADDTRLGLRIVDIKLTGEPSPSHFAELAYYQMTLAAWLEHTGRTDRFVVLKDAAVWPGKHEASEIRRLEAEDRRNGVPDRDLSRYLEGFEKDLEFLPAEVVLGRVRRFLTVDLREVLIEPDWRALPWHINSGCSGCDYLGYSWRQHADEQDEEIPPDQDRSPYCWRASEVTFHDEDFRDGCRAIYEKEKAEGTDLLAIIGRIRDHLELEEKRVEREREVARKEWEQQDLINREKRLHSGADCGWVRPTGSPFYYCRKNGRTFRLSQSNRDFVLLHQVSTLSHEESGIFIGKYRRRREATRDLSVVAYSPDRPSA